MKPLESPYSPLVPVLMKAVQQSGIAIVFAAVLGYAVNRVYDDLGKRNEILVELVKEQVSSSKAVADSLTALSVQIERHGSALDRLERETFKSP